MVAELISSNGTERAHMRPFVFGDRWRWIDAPAMTNGIDIEGFAVEVKISLPNGELRAFQDALVDIDQRYVDLNGKFLIDIQHLQDERLKLMERSADGEPYLSDDTRTERLEKNSDAVKKLRDARTVAEDALMREKFALAAPHIRDWNAYDVLPDGELGEKVEPPRTGGAASLEYINPQMANWAVSTICNAWRLGKSLTPNVMPSSDTVALSQAPKGGPRVVNE